MKISILICLLLIGCVAEARIYIPIDQPADRQLPIAMTDLVNLGGGAKFAREIPSIIQNDLEISAYFIFISPDAFLEPRGNTELTTEAINFDLWTAIDARALIKGSISSQDDQLIVDLRLFDPFLKQMLVGKKYVGTKTDVRSIAHRFADEVMLALTGISGPFDSKITYTVPIGKGKKAIYLADADGANSRRLTDQLQLSLGPKFSPDGTKIVYTSYASGRPEVWLTTLDGQARQLTHNGATNISPAFSSDGSTILFTSSVAGDPDLWQMKLDGTMIGPLVPMDGIDVSPVYSPNGSQIAFASERAGDLHLFKMNADGSGLHRLTFVGKYNETPAFTPDGLRIAFCARDMGAFDIFTMNADGTFIQKLTSDAGNNTHPSWSPDGRYLIFGSSRDSPKKREDAIYIMRYDGANPTQITKKGELPWWGPRL